MLAAERREFAETRRVSELLTEDILDSIAPKVASGSCLLFLGSGVHAGPKAGSIFSYPDAERPPLGGDLAERLSAKSGYKTRFPNETDRNLLRVAQDFEVRKGRKELVEAIELEVERDRQPSRALKALAELDFKVIVTTNFDTLFDQALRSQRKKPYIGFYKKNEDTTRERADEPPDDRGIARRRPQANIDVVLAQRRWKSRSVFWNGRELVHDGGR
jgi:hypothetical protein